MGSPSPVATKLKRESPTTRTGPHRRTSSVTSSCVSLESGDQDVLYSPARSTGPGKSPIASTSTSSPRTPVGVNFGEKSISPAAIKKRRSSIGDTDDLARGLDFSTSSSPVNEEKKLHSFLTKGGGHKKVAQSTSIIAQSSSPGKKTGTTPPGKEKLVAGRATTASVLSPRKLGDGPEISKKGISSPQKPVSASVGSSMNGTTTANSEVGNNAEQGTTKKSSPLRVSLDGKIGKSSPRLTSKSKSESASTKGRTNLNGELAAVDSSVEAETKTDYKFSPGVSLNGKIAKKSSPRPSLKSKSRLTSSTGHELTKRRQDTPSPTQPGRVRTRSTDKAARNEELSRPEMESVEVPVYSEYEYEREVKSENVVNTSHKMLVPLQHREADEERPTLLPSLMVGGKMGDEDLSSLEQGVEPGFDNDTELPTSWLSEDLPCMFSALSQLPEPDDSSSSLLGDPPEALDEPFQRSSNENLLAVPNDMIAAEISRSVLTASSPKSPVSTLDEKFVAADDPSEVLNGVYQPALDESAWNHESNFFSNMVDDPVDKFEAELRTQIDATSELESPQLSVPQVEDTVDKFEAELRTQIDTTFESPQLSVPTVGQEYAVPVAITKQLLTVDKGETMPYKFTTHPEDIASSTSDNDSSVSDSVANEAFLQSCSSQVTEKMLAGEGQTQPISNQIDKDSTEVSQVVPESFLEGDKEAVQLDPPSCAKHMISVSNIVKPPLQEEGRRPTVEDEISTSHSCPDQHAVESSDDEFLEEIIQDLDSAQLNLKQSFDNVAEPLAVSRSRELDEIDSSHANIVNIVAPVMVSPREDICDNTFEQYAIGPQELAVSTESEFAPEFHDGQDCGAFTPTYVDQDMKIFEEYWTQSVGDESSQSDAGQNDAEDLWPSTMSETQLINTVEDETERSLPPIELPVSILPVVGKLKLTVEESINLEPPGQENAEVDATKLEIVDVIEEILPREGWPCPGSTVSLPASDNYQVDTESANQEEVEEFDEVFHLYGGSEELSSSVILFDNLSSPSRPSVVPEDLFQELPVVKGDQTIIVSPQPSASPGAATKEVDPIKSNAPFPPVRGLNDQEQTEANFLSSIDKKKESFYGATHSEGCTDGMASLGEWHERIQNSSPGLEVQKNIDQEEHQDLLNSAEGVEIINDNSSYKPTGELLFNSTELKDNFQNISSQSRGFNIEVPEQDSSQIHGDDEFQDDERITTSAKLQVVESHRDVNMAEVDHKPQIMQLKSSQVSEYLVDCSAEDDYPDYVTAASLDKSLPIGVLGESSTHNLSVACIPVFNEEDDMITDKFDAKSEVNSTASLDIENIPGTEATINYIDSTASSTEILGKDETTHIVSPFALPAKELPNTTLNEIGEFDRHESECEVNEENYLNGGHSIKLEFVEFREQSRAELDWEGPLLAVDSSGSKPSTEDKWNLIREESMFTNLSNSTGAGARRDTTEDLEIDQDKSKEVSSIISTFASTPSELIEYHDPDLQEIQLPLGTLTSSDDQVSQTEDAPEIERALMTLSDVDFDEDLPEAPLDGHAINDVEIIPENCSSQDLPLKLFVAPSQNTSIADVDDRKEDSDFSWKGDKEGETLNGILEQNQLPTDVDTVVDSAEKSFIISDQDIALSVDVDEREEDSGFSWKTERENVYLNGRLEEELLFEDEKTVVFSPKNSYANASGPDTKILGANNIRHHSSISRTADKNEESLNGGVEEPLVEDEDTVVYSPTDTSDATILGANDIQNHSTASWKADSEMDYLNKSLEENTFLKDEDMTKDSSKMSFVVSGQNTTILDIGGMEEQSNSSRPTGQNEESFNGSLERDSMLEDEKMVVPSLKDPFNVLVQETPETTISGVSDIQNHSNTSWTADEDELERLNGSLDEEFLLEDEDTVVYRPMESLVTSSQDLPDYPLLVDDKMKGHLKFLEKADKEGKNLNGTVMEEAVPEVEKTVPEVEKAMAEVEEAMPKVENAMHEVEDAMPEVEDAMPKVEEAMPMVEDAMPEVKDATPKVEDAMLKVEDAMAKAEDAMPEVEDAMPEVEDAMPKVDEAMPKVEDAMPEMEGAMPEVEDAMPEVKDAMPKVEDAMPEVKDAMPEVADAMPEVADAMPEVEDAMFKVEDAMPKVDDAMPKVEDAMPEMEDAMPEVKDAMPKVEDAMPEVEEAMPEMEDAMPEVKDAMPKVEDAMPEVEEAMPEMEDAMPEVKDAMPKVEDAMPEMEDAMPEVEDAMPKVEDAMPEVEDAMPKVEDAMPEVDDIMPEVEDAVPEGEEAMPEVHETVVDNHEETLVVEISPNAEALIVDDVEKHATWRDDKEEDESLSGNILERESMVEVQEMVDHSPTESFIAPELLIANAENLDVDKMEKHPIWKTDEEGETLTQSLEEKSMFEVEETEVDNPKAAISDVDELEKHSIWTTDKEEESLNRNLKEEAMLDVQETVMDSSSGNLKNVLVCQVPEANGALQSVNSNNDYMGEDLVCPSRTEDDAMSTLHENDKDAVHVSTDAVRVENALVVNTDHVDEDSDLGRFTTTAAVVDCKSCIIPEMTNGNHVHESDSSHETTAVIETPVLAGETGTSGLESNPQDIDSLEEATEPQSPEATLYPLLASQPPFSGSQQDRLWEEQAEAYSTGGPGTPSRKEDATQTTAPFHPPSPGEQVTSSDDQIQPASGPMNNGHAVAGPSNGAGENGSALHEPKGKGKLHTPLRSLLLEDASKSVDGDPSTPNGVTSSPSFIRRLFRVKSTPSRAAERDISQTKLKKSSSMWVSCLGSPQVQQ